MPDLISKNPATGEILGNVPISTDAEIKEAVASARAAQLIWKEFGVTKRIGLLQKAYDLFKGRSEELARLVSREMGMPLTQSRDDMTWGLDYFKWYLDNTEKYLAPEVTHEDSTSLHTVYREPIGAAAVIIPWNFPFSNFIWGAIPNLLVGNTVVLKHSEECPLSGKWIEEIIRQINLPPGIFTELYGDGTVGEKLINEPIDLIWFTGSSATGKHLYELGAKKFIKVILELGGSAPGIVFKDVNLDETAQSIYGNRFSNGGQMCDALKRLIVHKDIADALIEKLKTILASKIVGNPLDQETDIGPLVAEQQVKLLEAQVDDAVQKGAAVVCGGKISSLGHLFFEPTILTNISEEMRVWQEEIFGPVLPITTFETEEKAIKLANDTKYGLGAYVYTKDNERAQRIARKLESGMVSVNGVSYVCPPNPFGGYKQSGLGREHGHFGLHELTQVKVVSKRK